MWNHTCILYPLSSLIRHIVPRHSKLSRLPHRLTAPVIFIIYMKTTTTSATARNKDTTPPTTIRNFVLTVFGLLAAYIMAGLFQRLFRPFSSSTMHFSPETAAQAAHVPEGAQLATIAAGCFWGVEHMYRHDFKDKGLIDARVGYIGGNTKDPSYRAVCSGRTGHAEACQIVFDPEKVSYRTLLEYFYKMHDPTTQNRQGPDTGSQYRSGIFYHNEEQKSIAEEVTKKASEQWWKGGIVTEILPAGEWWDAEKYHQLYLQNNPGGYECPSHFLRKFPPLQ